jgi:hypothetical protein
MNKNKQYKTQIHNMEKALKQAEQGVLTKHFAMMDKALEKNNDIDENTIVKTFTYVCEDTKRILTKELYKNKSLEEQAQAQKDAIEALPCQHKTTECFDVETIME